MGIRTVMIVEDHGGTRAAVSRYFLALGWEVLDAGSVAEAMATLDTGAEPSLLILDLMLPDGEGEAVLRRVRASKFRCFVVVASAVSDETRLRAVLWLGPDRVLPKPYALPELCVACGFMSPHSQAKWTENHVLSETWAD